MTGLPREQYTTASFEGGDPLPQPPGCTDIAVELHHRPVNLDAELMIEPKIPHDDFDLSCHSVISYRQLVSRRKPFQ